MAIIERFILVHLMDHCGGDERLHYITGGGGEGGEGGEGDRFQKKAMIERFF
jgi:hypothetical protein